jgi:membrane protein
VKRLLEGAVGFGRDCFGRFIAVQGIDRAMALSAQAFTALLPLLVVYAAVVPQPSGEDFAARVIKKFGLEGASADSVRQAFAPENAVQSSVTALGVFLLIVSALSFTRGLQRLFEGAYRLPALGMRGTGYGLQWIGLVVVLVTLRPIAIDALHGVANAIATLSSGTLLWLATPYLLMGKRLAWRRLLPGAVLTAIAMSLLGVASLIWIPRTLDSLSSQFGFIGVAFAIVSWLFAAGCVLVGSASIGAVIDERRHAP